MEVTEHFLDRIEQAKTDFKQSVCRQVDELFGVFVQELKSSPRSGGHNHQQSWNNQRGYFLPPHSTVSPLQSIEFNQAMPSRCTAHQIVTLLPNAAALQVDSASSTPLISYVSRPLPQHDPLFPRIKQEIPDDDDNDNEPNDPEIEQIEFLHGTKQPSLPATAEHQHQHQQHQNFEDEEGEELDSECESDCNCADCVQYEEMIKEEEDGGGSDDDGLRRAKKLKMNNSVASTVAAAASAAGSSSATTTTRTRRKFQCSFVNCDKTFTGRPYLKRHYRQAHSTDPTPDLITTRPYPCSFPACGKTFRNQHHLKDHQRIHTGSRPFRCKWIGCAYDAAQRSDVIKHIRIVHFKLPKSQKEQAMRNIQDDRDPAMFLEIVQDQL